MRLLISLLLCSLSGSSAFAQSMDRKTHHLEVERVLMHDAADVWAVLAVDYGRVARSHPRIIASEYVEGTLKGELGAERFCYFNDKHSKALREQIVAYDEEKYSFDNRILEAPGFPIDTDNTLATWTVTPLGKGKSKVSVVMDFRTRPAMMGAMAKGGFRNLLEDYMLSLDHHISTGESVTRENFKEIAKLYK